MFDFLKSQNIVDLHITLLNRFFLIVKNEINWNETGFHDN